MLKLAVKEIALLTP